MTAEQQMDLAWPRREILVKMRSMTPPPNYIGACDSTEIRDTSLHFTYHGPPCRDEQVLNEFILSSLVRDGPSTTAPRILPKAANRSPPRLLPPRPRPWNIIVQDGKIKGLVDWEDGGWYQEYWEFVKFIRGPAAHHWKDSAEEIFPEIYLDKLVDFTAMSKWQNG